MEALTAERTIFVVEGEAKVDLLHSWGLSATCSAQGAGKFRMKHAEYLRGADVVLIPDNDDPGFKHVQDIGAKLSGIAKRVRVLRLPDLLPRATSSTRLGRAAPARRWSG